MKLVATITLNETGQSMSATLWQTPDFFIHFCLPKKYDGDFGFDWLRKEYLPIDEGGQGICVSDINDLKKEYHSEDVENPFSLRGKDYYCSFLNVFPNKKIKLSLVRENLINPPLDNSDIVIYFDYEENYFEFSSSEFNFTEIPSEGDSGYKEIELTCISPLTKNTEIKIKIREKDDPKREDDPEVGKLMVMKNDIQYKLNVRFVEVEFKGSLFKRITEIDKEVMLNFSKKGIDYTITDNISNPDYNKRTKTQIPVKNKIMDWKKYIEINQQFFEKLLRQASIIYNPIRDDVNNVIDYRKIIIDFKNKEVGARVRKDQNINNILSSITNISMDFIGIKENEEAIMNFLEGLIGIYNQTYTKSDEEGAIIFLLPMNILAKEDIKGKNIKNANHEQVSRFLEELRPKKYNLDAFSDSFFKEGKYIMLINNHNDIIKSILVHEVGHTLGLLHSFQETEIDPITNQILKPIHSFFFGKTDNIMDYPSENEENKKQESFFKWQWKIMQNDTNDLKNK